VPNTFRVRKHMGFRLPSLLLPSLNVSPGFSCRLIQAKIAAVATAFLVAPALLHS
jgi:hypothetical protein